MREIRILHIIDDKKFIESCKLTFNVKNVSNFFLTSGRVSEEFLKDNSIDVLVIHYLRLDEINFLNTSNCLIPVIWFFWGGDGFSLGKFFNKFLFPKTKSLKIKLAFKTSYKRGFIEVSKRVFSFFLDYQSYNRNFIRSLKQIDIIIPVVPGDYTLLKDNYNIQAKSFQLNYINNVFYEPEHSVNGKNILLGNSADSNNNHVESLDVLCNINLENRKVIIPLNYGSDKHYTNYIIKYAQQKIPHNVVFLVDFLPIEAYHKLIKGCEIVIMNHLRQQALGNIIFALYNGATVYLQTQTTLYNFLLESGFYIFDIKLLPKLNVLTSEQRVKNNLNCVEIFGPSTQHKKLNTLLTSLDII